MVGQVFFTLVDDLSSARVGYDLTVPVLQPIDHPLQSHPPARVAVKVITRCLFYERAPEAGAAAFDGQLLVQVKGFADAHLNEPAH